MNVHISMSNEQPPIHSQNTEKPIMAYKEECEDGFAIEFEALPTYNSGVFKSIKQMEISEAITFLDEKSDEVESRIANLNSEIDRLTNNSDNVDYMIAVGCGVLCGIIDSSVVGEFNFDEALEKSKERVNEFVIQKSERLRQREKIKEAIEGKKSKALSQGKKLSAKEIRALKKEVTEGLNKTLENMRESDANNETSRVLQRAIKKLEQVYKIPSDNVFSGAKIGVTTMTHHLDDLAHHPTILGLVAAVAGVFLRVCVYNNGDGEWAVKFAETDKKELLKVWIPIIVSGILTWLLFVAKSKYKDEIDDKLPKPIQKIIRVLVKVPAAIQILNVANNWLGHLASDMAGSKNTAGAGKDGMGIPGLFVSMFKELSGIPPLNKTRLPSIVEKIFVDDRFDLRHELALVSELGRQAIPVIIGEITVRTFYFVRHLVEELKEHNNLNLINWQNVIPFNNRTIARMMTIETGTFTAIDLADAAIRSAIETGPPVTPAFWSKFLLRVNFVGIGRFVIAVGTDVSMGVKRQKLINERMRYKAIDNTIQITKLYYLSESMWIEISNTEEAIRDMCSYAQNYMNGFVQSWSEISESIEIIQEIDFDQVEKNNPGLRDEMKNTLEWS